MTDAAIEQPNELQKFILAEVFRQSSTPEIHKLIETKVSEAMKSAIDIAFRSYGDIGKQIEKVVANSLQLSDRMDMPTYGTMVMALLRERLDAQVHELVANKLDAEMTEILSIAPRELKLSDLVEQVVKKAEEDSRDRYGSHITCVIEKNEKYDWYEIGLDVEENCSRRDCEIQITVSQDGAVLSARIDGKDPKTTLRMGPMWDYQKMIFGAYCCGSKIILDDLDPPTGVGDL